MIYYACQSNPGSLSRQLSQRGMWGRGGAVQEKHIMKADCAAWGWDWNRNHNRHQHRFRRTPCAVACDKMANRLKTRYPRTSPPPLYLPSLCGRRQQREQQQQQQEQESSSSIQSATLISTKVGGRWGGEGPKLSSDICDTCIDLSSLLCVPSSGLGAIDWVPFMSNKCLFYAAPNAAVALWSRQREGQK